MEGTCSTIISSEDGARGSLAKEQGRPVTTGYGRKLTAS